MIQQLPPDKGLFTFYKQQQKAEDQLRKAHLVKAKCKTSIKSLLKKTGKNKEKINGISFQQASKVDITAKTERNEILVQETQLKRKKTLDLDLWKNRKERGKNHSQIFIKAQLNYQSDRQSFKHLKDHLRNLIGVDSPEKTQDKEEKQINENLKQLKSNTESHINMTTVHRSRLNKQKIIFEKESQIELKNSIKGQKRKGNLKKLGFTKSIPHLNKRLSQKLPKIEKYSRGKYFDEDLSFCRHINHLKYINPQRLNREPVLHQISTQKNQKKEYQLNFELISPSKQDKENILIQTPRFPQKLGKNVFSDIKFQQLISKIKFN